MKSKPLKYNRLRNFVDPKSFKFKTTKELKPLSGVIGQERAVKSIEFGLGMKGHGYNIFVTGLSGTGKSTIVKQLLHKLALKDKSPDDWIFVYNFAEPDHPRSFSLPPGKGCVFEKDMSLFINSLKIELPKSFSDKAYEDKREHLNEEFNKKRSGALRRLENFAKRRQIVIQNATVGYNTIPIVDGREMTPDDYDALKDIVKKRIDKKIDEVHGKISSSVKEITRYENRLQEQLETLDKDVAEFTIDRKIDPLMQKYDFSDSVSKHLKDVKNDIISNLGDFIPTSEEKGSLLGLQIPQSKPSFIRYSVNVVVSNIDNKCAPVIIETNPTFQNLFGRIEKKVQFGALVTDFTLIKPGSLLQANGGYLIVDIESILGHPFVWEALKRTLKNKELHIEDMSEELGLVSTVGLKPEPIPLDIKIVLLGRADIFHHLEYNDESFRRTFKVRADFDNSVKMTGGSTQQYAKFISKVCNEENLRHFDRTGVAALIEHAQRSISDQQRVSIQFGHLVNTIRESSYTAGLNNRKFVSELDVDSATRERRFRSNLLEEKIREQVNRDIITLNISKEIIGQINGLAVYQAGDHSFGVTSRITATVFAGKGNVVQIDREVKMSGSTHNKGVLILSSFLNKTFAVKAPISLSASITFEQNYSFIDGDSASSTELYALLSALSSTAINQSIAVTGSVDQFGNVQAIGGVNQKIEGYFDICLEKGFTGKQGVMIPAANVQHLMIRKDIIEVVRAGHFNVWPIKTIEQGIEMLTGIPAGKRLKNGKFQKGTLFNKIENRLTEYHRESLKFRQEIKKELGLLNDEKN